MFKLSLLVIAVLPSILDCVIASELEESTSSRDKNISIKGGKKRIYLKEKKFVIDFVM